MRVLFLTHGFPREPQDPVGSFVLRLAVLLRDEGITVHVVAPAAPGLAQRDTIEGVTVERFRYAPRRFETLAYSGTMMTQVKESPAALAALGTLVTANAAAAFRAIGREHADLVHAHWWFPSGLAGAMAARVRGVPLVTTLHGSDIRAARAAPGAGVAFRYVLDSSAVVTAVSRWLAEEAAALAPGRVPRVAPMPVDPALFHPAAGERARDRLLFVGKLNEQKGIAHLLRAMATMTSRPTLDIVVGPGSDEAPTRRLAAELGVDTQIRWHAMMPQGELAALYREVTALTAPMIGEGLGLIAVEAALSGLPIVAANSGGLRDIVVHGETGTLVPPADPAALSYALDALLARPDQGASLGAAGRVSALAHFSPAAVARHYADVYRQAIAEHAMR
jgi:glycosyltransferase involved in cell wall biosynthesis